MRFVAIGAIALAIGLGAAGGGGGGGGPTTANLWIDGNGGTCTRSASPVAYVDAAACDSVHSAYSACRNGDTVLIVAGTYASGDLVNFSNSNLSSFCTFIGQGTVNITGNLHLTSCGSGCTSANWLKFQSLNLSNVSLDSNTSSPVNHVTFDQVTLLAPKIGGDVANLTISNSTLDGQNNFDQPQFGAYYPGCCSTDPPGLTLNPTDITITGNTFRNYTCPGGCGAVHTECLQIRDWSGTLTVSRNLFYNCDATAYFSFANQHGTGTANVTNNVFGCGGTASQAATLPVDSGSTINFAYNSSACKSFGNQDPGDVVNSTWVITGNYSPFDTTLCHGTNTFNLATGGNCTGTGNTTVASLDFVNGAGNDFHLTGGANAIDQGGSACSTYTPDYYGATRPAGAACDAGASEHT